MIWSASFYVARSHPSQSTLGQSTLSQDRSASSGNIEAATLSFPRDSATLPTSSGANSNEAQMANGGGKIKVNKKKEGAPPKLRAEEVQLLTRQ